MSSSVKYQLQIVRARGLRWIGRSLQPDPYVRVSFGDFFWRSRVVRKNINPSWDETIQLPAADHTMIVSINVIHESFRDQFLGGISVSVAQLLEMGNTHDHGITLNLESWAKNESKVTSHDIGSIAIRLLIENTSEKADDMADLSFLNDDIMKPLVQQFLTERYYYPSIQPLKQLLSENPSMLHDLAQEVGGAVAFEKRVMIYQAAIRLSRSNDRQSKFRGDFGIALLENFQQHGQIADLQDAVLNLQEAVNATPKGHLNLAFFLNNLGVSLQTRFKQSGDIADVDMAILHLKKAIHLTPQGHSDLQNRLINLGNSFQIRFQRLQDTTDLEEAIHLQEQVIDITPSFHPDLSGFLNDLGVSFQARFRQLHDIADLEKAIHCKKKAVNITPMGDPNLAMYLSNLGNSFQMHFDQMGDTADLNNAILYHNKAVHIASNSHPDFSGYLNNLGKSFLARFQQLGDTTDLDKAILHSKEAVHNTPDGHPDLPNHLMNFGAVVLKCVRLSKTIEDVKMAISLFSRAAKSFGAPSKRFKAVLIWLKCIGLIKNPQISAVLEAYTCALEVLPQLAWLGQNIHSQYHALAVAKSVACDAAAASLNAHKTIQALEWLEGGRSIILGQLLQLHTPLETLHAINPQLADRLSYLSEMLETKGYKTVEEHRMAAREWEKATNAVRETPGFEQFLLPKQYSELSQASCNGPVIVVNMSKHRCDALIIKSPLEPLLHIPLKTFSYELAQNLHIRLQSVLTRLRLRSRGDTISNRAGGLVQMQSADEHFRDILAELWVKVVKPILDELLLKPSQHHLPRIWWCPTGPLSFLPIHAAGIYPVEKGDYNICLADYAISSYTPTVTALLVASQKASQEAKEVVKILAVIQSNTPGKSSLPGTEEELRIIQQLLVNHQILNTLEGSNATVEVVLSKIGQFSWVHLACHGKQDIEDPTKSGFFLEDGCLELSKIIEKSLPNASFAYLSACQTATGDEKQPDEVIHLAAGMLTAGYQSIIATMWSIGDDDAPLITNDVYSHLLRDNIPNNKKAAYALHVAMKSLYEKYNGTSFVSWVPFIHMGV